MSLLGGSGFRKPVTIYFTPFSRRAAGRTLSFGISILIEFDGSSTFVFMTSCQTICPRRERNQLTKTVAACGCAALLTIASPLLPLRPMPLPASLRCLRSNSLTAIPSLLACSTSAQPMHRTNLPDASQSVACRRSRDTVTFISPNRRLIKSGPRRGQQPARTWRCCPSTSGQGDPNKS